MSCLDEFNPTTHAAVVLTLSHLRRLLDMALAHAENPALDRCERTVEGVARAYLPRWLEWTWAPGVGIDVGDHGPYATVPMLRALHQGGTQVADLTDPGTVGAVRVALALALGLDPGVMGLGCSWFVLPETPAAPWRRWCLMADHLCDFVSIDTAYMGSIHAPTVANEPDPVRALCLAVLHVLGAP